MTPQDLMAAGDGDARAAKRIEEALFRDIENRTASAQPSTGQDMARGRRTEIDYINGLVSEKGREVGVPTPNNDAMVSLVKRIERGGLKPDTLNISGI